MSLTKTGPAYERMVRELEDERDPHEEAACQAAVETGDDKWTDPENADPDCFYVN